MSLTIVSAAQKLKLVAANPIVPLVINMGGRVTENLQKAVFRAPCIVVWLSRCPKRGLPGGAVRPLPDALLLDVVTPDPDLTKVSSCHASQNELLGRIGLDRGQMASLFTAIALSCGPVLLLAAPEVAMVSFLLPAFGAGFHTFVLAVG